MHPPSCLFSSQVPQVPDLLAVAPGVDDVPDVAATFHPERLTVRVRANLLPVPVRRLGADPHLADNLPVPGGVRPRRLRATREFPSRDQRQERYHFQNITAFHGSFLT